MPEVEVFRITPEKGKCYKTAEFTRQTGSYSKPPERYYTTNEPRYVGQFLGTVIMGSGDGMTADSYFVDEGGKENRVSHSYEGRTSFIQVLCGLTAANKARGGKTRSSRKRKTHTLKSKRT